MDCYQCGKPVDGRGFEVTDVGPMHPACYRRLINDKQTIATLRAEVERFGAVRKQVAEQHHAEVKVLTDENAALRAEVERLTRELAEAQSCACSDCNGEILRLRDEIAGLGYIHAAEASALRAEVEKHRAIANQMVGALRLDLPENESTEMLLTHAYHRIVESQYMLTQLSRTLGGGEVGK